MKLHLVHHEIGRRQRLRTVGAGVGSHANISEALRAVALAKRLAQLGQEAVAVLSWYNSQVGGLLGNPWIQREFLIVSVGT